MEDLKIVIDQTVSELETIDQTREKVIHLTRKLNRVSGRGIAKVVKEEDYSQNLNEARTIIDELISYMGEISTLTGWDLTKSGTEEYAEFEILHAITSDSPIPSPEKLDIPSYIWITGLGDVIGELRRMMLNKIIENDLSMARVYLHLVQDIFELIVGLEFSKSLVSNLRRKIDIARTLVEKCESDFANAMVNKST